MTNNSSFSQFFERVCKRPSNVTLGAWLQCTFAKTEVLKDLNNLKGHHIFFHTFKYQIYCELLQLQRAQTVQSSSV